MGGGGAERVAASLANAWVERGHQVTLMPTFSGRGGCVYPLSCDVRLEYLADHVGGARGRLRRLVALRTYIRRSAPDVIVSFLPDVNVAAIFGAAGTGVPVIACERTYPPLLAPPLPIVYRILRRLSYPHAAMLVGQTEEVREWLRGICPRTPIQAIPNMVRYPLPAGRPVMPPGEVVPPDRPLILAAGRLDGWKRFDVLISAFTSLAAQFPDWHLVILGEGRERATLERRVEAAGLAGRAHLPGFAGNLGDWYARADLFVMTSAYEGFPNTLLEAMAYGLPAVAFDVRTGPREITAGGRRAVLLPDHGHVARLIEALGALIQDADRRHRLGLLATEVREEFSMERVLSAWESLFEKLA